MHWNFLNKRTFDAFAKYGLIGVLTRIEEFISINELANVIAGKLDFDLSPIYFPDRPQEVFLANCSANKARDYLGYNTTVSLNDGIGELINWIKSKGPKNFDYHLPIEIINEKTPKTWTMKLI